MRVPISWLREYVELPAGTTVREVARRLIAAGLEVETVDELGADLTGPHLARVASEREVADDFAAFAHHDVVVLVVVRFHRCERRLLARDREPFIVVADPASERDITAAYTFIMNNYKAADGDRLFLFGFSRGAYTVRAVASLLRSCGVLRPGHETSIPYAIRLMNAIGTKGRRTAKRFRLVDRFAWLRCSQEAFFL